ncbi:unnamed protein product, partial [Iphiclides podalirius]
MFRCGPFFRLASARGGAQPASRGPPMKAADTRRSPGAPITPPGQKSRGYLYEIGVAPRNAAGRGPRIVSPNEPESLLGTAERESRFNKTNYRRSAPYIFSHARRRPRARRTRRTHRHQPK